MTISQFKPREIPRSRTSDSIFEVLRDSILSQIFLPGERLSPHELAKKFDVSPTPIRDALNRLASEGLVEVRPRSGTFVSDLSPREVLETFEIRAALEGLAAEFAVENLTPSSLQKVRDLVEEMNKGASTDRERAIHEQRNTEFHALIVELSGNRKLVEMYHQLNAHIAIARIHYGRSGWANRMDKERTEHQKILRALEQRDGKKLATLLQEHIRNGARRLTEDLVKSSKGGRK